MLTPEPEDQAGDQQHIQTVGMLLESMTSPVAMRSYQQGHELPATIYNQPTDVALAEMLIYTGSNHIRSFYEILRGASNDFAIGPSDQADIAQSVTAAAFGVAYLALREFVTTATPIPTNHHAFDNTHFLKRFDKAMTGTPLSSKLLFPTDEPQLQETEIVGPADWNNMVDVARSFGFAALLNGYGWVKLPAVITQLISRIDKQTEVPQLVERFQGVLLNIESGDEVAARRASILPPVSEQTRDNTQFSITRRNSPKMDIFQDIASDTKLMGQIKNL